MTKPRLGKLGGQMMRAGLIICVLSAVVAFYIFDLHHFLNLNRIQAELESFQYWREQSPWLAAGIGGAFYTLVVALSLPGSAVLSLTFGALFGLWVGMIIVVFAASFGALLAFLIARYLLRDWVQSRWSRRLMTINKGIEQQGAWYLLTMRLVPIFPFFLINFLMALTPISARMFFGVTLLGILPGVGIFVNAGQQLAQLTELRQVLSPDLLLSLTLLGLFPWVMKTALQTYRHHRRYRRWHRPKRFERNLIVIGAGAGGLVSSYIGSTLQAKVTLIEAKAMGGDCLNEGCVPSKAFIHCARLNADMSQATQDGIALGETKLLWSKVMAWVQASITAIEPHDSVERYSQLGVEVLQGYARLVDPWTVDIELSEQIEENEKRVRRITARRIILATGAEPVVPKIPGIEQSGYLTSATLWPALAKLDQAPKHLLMIGGGSIGCELAQAFAQLGSQVTLVEQSSRLLSQEDTDVSEIVRDALLAAGVHLKLGYQVVRFVESKSDRQYTSAVVTHQSKAQTEEEQIDYDMCVCAVGRKPRLAGYGLEGLGIATDKQLVTNAFLQTEYPHIYAVGDVIGPYQLTHAAANQAWYACVNALFGQFKRFKVDDRVLPRVTFTNPEVARVGVSEQEAQAQGLAYEVVRYKLSELDRAIITGKTQGFVKVLVVPGKDKILGVSIVAHHAGEMLAEWALAMRHGVGLNKLLSTIHSYPTWNEANRYVAGQWKRERMSPRLQAILRWFFQRRLKA